MLGFELSKIRGASGNKCAAPNTMKQRKIKLGIFITDPYPDRIT